MQRLTFVFMCVLLIVPHTVHADQTIVELVKNVRPSVVLIQAFDRGNNLVGQGSGFFINDKGDVITNKHVVEGAHSATVKLITGEQYSIEGALAVDADRDVVKLRVRVEGKPTTFLKPVNILPLVGEDIVVVGNPLGLESTVSKGIVSAIREIPTFGNILQMSAPISAGSSGSPVLNTKGQVIGVAISTIKEGQALNFAIPSMVILNLETEDKLIKLSLLSLISSESGGGIENRNTARETKQKAQFATIELALTAFKNDYGDYPPSDWPLPPAPGSYYCGAQKLTEALLGWDMLGFHPESDFRSNGRNDDGVFIYDVDNPVFFDQRRGPYLELSTTNAFRLGNIFNNTAPLEQNTFVLCDVFGAKKVMLANGETVRAGAPILYYRANTSGRTIREIYEALDNDALILIKQQVDNKEHPLTRPGGQFQYFYDYIRDPKISARAWPYRSDSYILISAGADGLYGTSDDIRNFGNYRQGIYSIPNNEVIWAKCVNPACKAEYQTSKKGYFKYIEEHANLMAPSAPPMVCEKCGELSVYRAEKCVNPDCRLVFFRGAVPNDFPDRCPDCKRSETEEKRKHRRSR